MASYLRDFGKLCKKKGGEILFWVVGRRAVQQYRWGYADRSGGGGLGGMSPEWDIWYNGVV